MFCDCNIDARVSWQECLNEIQYLRQTQLLGGEGRGVLWYLDKHFLSFLYLFRGILNSAYSLREGLSL